MESFFAISVAFWRKMAYTAARISENGGTPMKHHPSWTALRSYAITAGLACLMGVSYELLSFPTPSPRRASTAWPPCCNTCCMSYSATSPCSSTCRWLLAWKKIDRDFAQNTGVRVAVLRRHAGAGPDGPRCSSPMTPAPLRPGLCRVVSGAVVPGRAGSGRTAPPAERTS